MLRLGSRYHPNFVHAMGPCSPFGEGAAGVMSNLPKGTAPCQAAQVRTAGALRGPQSRFLIRSAISIVCRDRAGSIAIILCISQPRTWLAEAGAGRRVYGRGRKTVLDTTVTANADRRRGHQRRATPDHQHQQRSSRSRVPDSSPSLRLKSACLAHVSPGAFCSKRDSADPL